VSSRRWTVSLCLASSPTTRFPSLSQAELKAARVPTRGTAKADVSASRLRSCRSPLSLTVPRALPQDRSRHEAAPCQIVPPALRIGWVLCIVTPASSEGDAVDSETPSSGVDGSRTDQKGPSAATGEKVG
jgi:hypothetical protein